VANDFKIEEQMRKELEEARKKVIVGGKYAHYKHPDEVSYELVEVGILESTMGVCVIYKQFKTGFLFVRTLEDFTAEVEVEGKKVKRFSYAGK